VSKTEQNTPGWQAMQTILLLFGSKQGNNEYLSHGAYCTNTCGMINGWRQVK